METKHTQGPLSRLWQFAKVNKAGYITSIILAIAGVMSGLLPYFAVSRMIIGLLQGESKLWFYLMWCMVVGLGYIGKVLFANISTTISHTTTFKTLKEIRKVLISKLSRVPMGYLLDTPSGQLKDLIVDRVEGLETTLAHMVPEMTANIFVPLLLIAYLFTIDWRMALISLITLPIGMLIMVGAMRDYPKQYEGSVKTNMHMTNTVVEYINGIEVIKTFNQSANSYKKYTDAVNDNASYFYYWMKSCQKQMSSYTVICPSVLVTVLPFGFLFYAGGSLTSHDFVTIIILSLGIVGPLLAAMNYMDSLAIVGTVTKQIDDLIKVPDLRRPDQPAKLKDLDIGFRGVSFSYKSDGTEPVLDNINLAIPSGSVTALVGPSGGGKSTITKLIAGFWDITKGEITIGGVDLRNIPQRQLADCVAYVSQDNYLFDTTIRENIRFGNRDASDCQVEAMAKAAGCDAFIGGLEHGYDTHVGSGGGHLSGGERQRIAIARAMLKDAPIVILDEATAYTDPENEAVIQAAVSKLVECKTLIVIAHRLSTITDSDQIVVVENGRIAAVGRHEELLKSCLVYRNMWQAHMDVKDGDVA